MEGIGANGLKTKLIINYLPQSMSDSEFEMLFSQIGPMESAKVMRDKATDYSFGYGFVDYKRPEDAYEAIDKLNGHKMQHKTLKVAFSKPSGTSKNINLYVNGLGAHVTDVTLRMLFSNHGEIVNTKVLTERDGSSKGAGFVLFKQKTEADAAIRALQGYVDDYGSNFQIKYAKDTSEQQRTHPRYQQYLQKKQDHHTTQPAPLFQQDSYNAQDSYSSYGYSLPQHNSYDNAATSDYSGGYGGGYGGGYSTERYGSSDGGQKAARGRGGGAARYNPIARPMNGNGMYMQNQPQVDAENPTVVFVYNIGPTATQGDMYAMFAKHGRISKVDVIEGKGFAFVHMPIEYEASEAVSQLNGQEYNGKLLQVSIKKQK